MSIEAHEPNRTRRDFLAASAATGLALGLAGGSASAARADKALRVGTIGSGGRCRELLKAAKLLPELKVVSVCDVWDIAPRRR